MAISAISGEPWRAQAWLRVNEGVANKSWRWRAYGSFSGSDSEPWEVEGATVSLQFQLTQPTSGVFTNPPTHLDYCVALPYGGGNIGPIRTHTLDGSGNGAPGTLTIRFDTDPLANDVANALRSGTVELWMRVRRGAFGSTSLGDWSADTRGTVSGAAAGGTPTITGERARGYIRRRVVLASSARDNSNLFDGQPDPFSYPDSIHLRAALTEDTYTAISTTQGVMDGATARRQGTSSSGTTGNKDVAFTATSGVTGRVNADFATVGAHTHRIVLPDASFGGIASGQTTPDYDYCWATAGHEAGAVRVSDTTLDAGMLMNVDAELRSQRLMVFNQPVWATPPGSIDQGMNRQQADLGLIAARITNARGEGINQSLANEGLDYSLRDSGSVVTPITLLNQATVTQGGEAGWGPFMGWESQLPGGNWTNALTFTDESGQQRFAPGHGAHGFVLLAADPRVVVAVGGGSSGDQANHFTPGDTFIVGASCIYSDVGDFCDIDAGSVYCAIQRLNLATGVAETLDADGVTWTVMTHTQPAIWHAMGSSPADPDHIFMKTFSPSQTSNWGLYDLIVVGKVKINGTPYANYMQVPVTGKANQHSRYIFDIVGQR